MEGHDSINNTGPVGVRVHGTLRRDALLAARPSAGLNAAARIALTRSQGHEPLPRVPFFFFLF